MSVSVAPGVAWADAVCSPRGSRLLFSSQCPSRFTPGFPFRLPGCWLSVLDQGRRSRELVKAFHNALKKLGRRSGGSGSLAFSAWSPCFRHSRTRVLRELFMASIIPEHVSRFEFVEMVKKKKTRTRRSHPVLSAPGGRAYTDARCRHQRRQ